MCPISLRNWHAYISKYGPSQTWFVFKSDVTLWAQEDMSLFYVSTASLDLLGISGAIRILGILLVPLKNLF